MAYLQAAIFDMDGVVLNTAKLHYAAWKMMFDIFLKEHSHKREQDFQPFSELDYLFYVDGISRYDGVRNFLVSRQIEIPMGLASDAASEETIYGLSRRKDQLFHKLVEEEGVEAFPSSIQFIQALRQQKIKTAIISASKNCKMLLEHTHIEHLFDIKLDGNDIEQKKLHGKPAPDVFIEATHLLEVVPENTMVVEDALAGVQAGFVGKFGLIVGVDRSGVGTQIFKESGADLVVNDLSELIIEGIKHWFSYQLVHVYDIQGALNPDLLARLNGKQLILFLDYDGTLTPIVEHPELAVLSNKMYESLRELSQRYTLVIISGRQLSDLQEKVNIPGIYYAGNHGLEISGPNLQHIEGEGYLEDMANAYKDLMARVGTIPGVLLENKKFTLSVHFRLVSNREFGKVQHAIKTVLKAYPRLICRGGKKIFEIRPNIDWHKGKAVLWILEALQLNRFNILPVYIGDDVTDEDAFRTLKPFGMSIIVSRCKQTTKAQYCLRNIPEVEKFLTMLLRGGYD